MVLDRLTALERMPGGHRIKVVRMSKYRIGKLHSVLPIFPLVIGILLVAPTHGDDNSSNQADADHATLVQLADVVRFNDTTVRTMGLRLLLAGANEETLVEFLKRSRNLELGELGIEIQLAIVRELALLDPKEALRQARDLPSEAGESVVRTIFQVWSIKDLDQAIDSAKHLEGDWNDYAVDAILSARSDLSSEDRLNVASQLMGKRLANTVLGLMDATAPIDDPESAWIDFVEKNRNKLDRLNVTEQIYLGTIGAALVEDMGLDTVLDRIDEELPDGPTKSRAVTSVLRSHAGNDAESALEYAIDLQHQIDPMVLSSISLQLAATDPEATLSALTSVRASGDRLRLQRDVVRTWTQIDPYAVATSLDTLPRSLHTYAREQALIAIAKDSIDNAVLMLPEVDNYESKLRVAETLFGHWAKTDLAGAINWINTDPGIADLSNELLPSVIDSVAREDPSLAMQMAQQDSIAELEVGSEFLVIRSVAKRNLEESIELLASVRNEATRLAALGEIGQVLIRTGEAHRAIQLGDENLTDNSRAKYISSIATPLLVDAPGVLAENLNALPSRTEQSKMAMMLLMRPHLSGELSEEQMKKARAFVPEGFTPPNLENALELIGQ